MEPNTGIKTWQWVVTIIVIIALIVIGILVFGNKKSAPTNTNTNATTTTQNNVGTNSLVLSDQFPGNVVYISSVQASAPVWVAIHKDNNGQPGDVIGYAHFEGGIDPGKVNLSESTIDGRTYYAMMHSDDGDSTFDASSDAPLKDANGNVIMRIFKASSSANAQIKG